MTVTKSLITGGLAGLIIGSSIVAWTSRATGAAREADFIDGANVSSTLSHRSRVTVPARWSAPKSGGTVEDVFEQVQQLLTEPDNEIGRLRIQGLLESLPADQFEPLLKLVEGKLTKYWELHRVAPQLARAWAKTDPRSAIEGLINAVGTAGWSPSKLTSEAFGVWNAAHSSEAQDWLVENQSRRDFSKSITEMITTVAKHLTATSGQESVVAWASEIKGEDFRRAALSPLWSSFTNDHFKADHSKELPRLLDSFGQIEDQDLAKLAIRSLTSEWAKWRNREFEGWLKTQAPGPLAYEAALASVGLEMIYDQHGSSYSTGSLPFGSKERLANAKRALRLSGTRNESSVVSEIVQEMVVIPKGLSTWVLPKLEGDDRDIAVSHVVQTLTHPVGNSEYDPPLKEALGWARYYSDPALRDSAIQRLYREWMTSPKNEGAADFPETSGWSEELKAVLRRGKEGL